jgi:hypothetical protein
MVTHTRMYIKSSIDIDVLQVVVYVYHLRASTGVRNRIYLFHVCECDSVYLARSLSMYTDKANFLLASLCCCTERI